MKIAGWMSLAAGAALLAGCGGGGSMSNGTTSGNTITGGTTRAAVLVTDSPREDYSHIWATIYHVELVPQSGAAVVLFNDTTGKQIDLKTLRDASGQRFSFLGSSAIPAGSYTGLNITVGATMQIFKPGATTGSNVTVDSSIPKDANGNPVIAVSFKSPKTLGAGTNNLIVDFDLAHFIVRDSKILPAVVEGAPTGVNDPNRHNDGDYRGMVSNLTGTAPDLTFTLTDPRNQTITVTTNAATALFGAGKLANGGAVSVAGTLDTTSGNLIATQIRVCGMQPNGKPAPENGAPSLAGAVTNINATAGTFTLTVGDAHGLLPAQSGVNVVVNATTQYFAAGGVTQTEADFFTALAATPNAEIVGTYDAATNTMTAAVAKVEDHSHDQKGNGPHDFRPGMDRNNWGHDQL